MFQIIGTIVLLWFAAQLIYLVTTGADVNEKTDDRNYGWLWYVPGLLLVVLIVNPDYGLKK